MSGRREQTWTELAWALIQAFRRYTGEFLHESGWYDIRFISVDFAPGKSNKMIRKIKVCLGEQERQLFWSNFCAVIHGQEINVGMVQGG